MLGPLADDEAHSARRGMDQDRLAWFDLMRAAQQVPGGHALQHHRRALLVGDAVGERHKPVGRHDPRLAIGAKRPAGIGDAVARLQIADPRPDLLDHPGRLGAEPARQRHLIQAAALVGVDIIEPDRRMAQPDLPLAGPADLDLLPFQHLGSAGLRKTDRLHHCCLHPFRIDDATIARPGPPVTTAAPVAIAHDAAQGGAERMRSPFSRG